MMVGRIYKLIIAKRYEDIVYGKERTADHCDGHGHEKRDYEDQFAGEHQSHGERESEHHDHDHDHGHDHGH